jgi:hypothetical protein
MAEILKPMIVKVADNTSKLSAPPAAAKLQVSVDAITAHSAMYTGITPSMADAQSDVTALTNSIEAVANKEVELEQLRAARDQALAKVRQTYALLGAWVENKAEGDASVILTAGFDLVQPRSTSIPKSLPAVLGHVLVSGPDEGMARGSWKPAVGGRSYEVQIAISGDNGPWTHYDTVSEPQVTITGQASGQKRWTRVRAVGAKSAKGPWSDPACAMIP